MQYWFAAAGSMLMQRVLLLLPLLAERYKTYYF